MISLSQPYVQGAELPDLELTLVDNNGDLYQFGSGHTFVLKIGTPAEDAVLSKTTGITGADIAPNVVVSWDITGEINDLEPDVYTAELVVTRTSDSKQWKRQFVFPVTAAIL